MSGFEVFLVAYLFVLTLGTGVGLGLLSARLRVLEGREQHRQACPESDRAKARNRRTMWD